MLNMECAVRCPLAIRMVASFRGLPTGRARRRRPTVFLNVHMVLPLQARRDLPVCVA